MCDEVYNTQAAAEAARHEQAVKAIEKEVSHCSHNNDRNVTPEECFCV